MPSIINRAGVAPKVAGEAGDDVRASANEPPVKSEPAGGSDDDGGDGETNGGPTAI